LNLTLLEHDLFYKLIPQVFMTIKMIKFIPIQTKKTFFTKMIDTIVNMKISCLIVPFSFCPVPGLVIQNWGPKE